MSDFALSLVDGKPELTHDESTGVLNDVILSFTIKRRSLARDAAGNPVYPGDWFIDPDFGQNIYEIETTSDQDIDKAAELGRQCVQWLIRSGRVLSADVSAARDAARKNTIAIYCTVIDATGTPVAYTHFHEVL